MMHDCTVSEFLKSLNDNHLLQKPVNLHTHGQYTDPKLTILGDYMLSSFGLLNYLHERRIPNDVASEFCREVRYTFNDKVYYAIGFKNDSGGYEIRSRYFKGSSSPKNITTFHNGAKEAAVFEGFFDFLSFLAISKNQQYPPMNYIILNSVSMFEKARPVMEMNDFIRLYLDRDSTGQNYSRYALSLSTKYKNESYVYDQYKDLNDWLVNMGMASKKTHQLSLDKSPRKSKRRKMQ
ncbi:MAG: toprim domain-containing protein [Segetibacter sp.]